MPLLTCFLHSSSMCRTATWCGCLFITAASAQTNQANVKWLVNHFFSLTAFSLLLRLPPTAVLAAFGQSKSSPAVTCKSWCAVKSRKRLDTATLALRTICTSDTTARQQCAVGEATSTPWRTANSNVVWQGPDSRSNCFMLCCCMLPVLLCLHGSKWPCTEVLSADNHAVQQNICILPVSCVFQQTASAAMPTARNLMLQAPEITHKPAEVDKQCEAKQCY